MGEEVALLEGLGLTRGEIRVYYALLALGPSTTGEIIKRARVSRSKVYEMLDRLLEKGLVSFVVRENVKYFEAASPDAIIDWVRKKRQQLTQQEEALRKILPRIKEKQEKAKFRQTATVYEGFAGIKTMFNEIFTFLKKGDEYYAIAVEPEVYQNKEFVTFLKNYHIRRAERGIRVRLLAMRALKLSLSELGGTGLIEIRYTDHTIPAATLIYKDNVATFVWVEDMPTGIVMRSPIIAQRYKDFFAEIWKQAKP